MLARTRKPSSCSHFGAKVLAEHCLKEPQLVERVVAMHRSFDLLLQEKSICNAPHVRLDLSKEENFEKMLCSKRRCF